MSNIALKTLLVVPALLGAAVVGAASASAQTVESAAANSAPSVSQIASYGNEGKGGEQDQVTSVSQLTDVRPTDWAFQALQSLVERYGCIVGYPDRTYRGNQALSRYEFAAGLNACLDRINELIAASTADLVKKEDLDALRKLQEEFAAELATLRGRVDALEARTATLERQQFSTTTKLRGEVIFSLADTFGDSATRTGSGGVIGGAVADDRTETVFSDRVRLSLNTSFSGKDLLVTRLQARNTAQFSGANLTGTNMTRLSYDGDEGNSVFVDKLYYRFGLGNAFRVQVDAINGELYETLIDPISPIASSGSGSISRFGRFNPIYRSGNPVSANTQLGGSAAVTFDLALSSAFKVQGGVLFDRGSNLPTATNGLFDGGINYAAQIVFQPSRAFKAGLTYIRSFYNGNDVNVSGSTGSGFAATPFQANSTTVDSFGAQAQFAFGPQFIVGGWFGAQFADQQFNGNNEATILNGAIYAAFPDLGTKGSLAAILVGVPPKVTDNDIGAREDNDTSIHVEGFYRFKLNDNIAITPGVFVIFNPEHNNDNDTQIVGVIRTTFTF